MIRLSTGCSFTSVSTDRVAPAAVAQGSAEGAEDAGVDEKAGGVAGRAGQAGESDRPLTGRQQRSPMWCKVVMALRDAANERETVAG